VPLGCNAIWGIDDLGYGQGASAGSAGWGLGAGGHGGMGAAAAAGGMGAAGAGGGGGSPCGGPCDSPPNLECYEPLGSCEPSTGDCIYAARADTTSCGVTSCADWGACAWDGPCSNSGSRQRSCTDYLCAAGSCGPVARTESDACAQTVADGTACSGGYCCSNSCVARNSNANCGSCGVHCGSQSCVQLHDHAGQYSCTCGSDSFCRGAGFGSLATCWNDGTQMLCNCQCASGTSCSGQCAGGGTCAHVTGQNYCHY
jgi:hypothetical protein